MSKGVSVEACKVEGCDKSSRRSDNGRGGFCKSHYQRLQKYGSPTGGPDDTMQVRVTCAVEACDRPAFARGWCSKHYSTWKRHGDPTASKERVSNRGKQCSAKGCEKEAKTRGLCITHYNRLIYEGDIYEDKPVREMQSIKDRQRCRWPDGCSELERARGYCSKHYQRIIHSKELEHLLPEKHRATRCVVRECDNPQYAKGFCRNHYAKHLRGANPLEEGQFEQPEYDTFGGRLYAHRLSKGWTLNDMGEVIGVSRERVRQLEKRSNPPRADTVKRVAEALELEPSELIGEHLPSSVGSYAPERKSGRPKIYKNIHIRCLWCGGKGALELATNPTDNGMPTDTQCAYCKGSGAIYVSPAPALEEIGV